MRRFIIILGFIILIMPVALWAGKKAAWLEAPKELPKQPQAIASLAPSLTEILFALGLDREIVGVTRFCNYPPAAQNKAKVAGFSDVNYEALLRQKPDLVVVPYDKTANIDTLKRLGLAVAPINNRSLKGLMESMPALGRLTGREAEAEALSASLTAAINGAEARNQGLTKRPKVLFVVMRGYEGLGRITELSAVGRDGFYDEIITLAGGENVYKGDLPFPKLSRESILKLNPDVIIDVIPPGADIAQARADWQSLGRLKAIENDRLLILNNEAATVPGPRFPEVLSKISDLIHQDDGPKP